MGDGHYPQYRINIWENDKLIIDVEDFNSRMPYRDNINFIKYTAKYIKILNKEGLREEKRVLISGHDPISQFYSKNGSVKYFELEFNLVKNRIINTDLIRNTRNKEYISYETLTNPKTMKIITNINLKK